MSRSRFRWAWGPALISVLLLAFPACGGGDESGDSSRNEDVTSAGGETSVDPGDASDPGDDGYVAPDDTYLAPDESEDPDTYVKEIERPSCSCGEKECGFDHCGDSCGTCPEGSECKIGKCEALPLECTYQGFSSVAEQAEIDSYDNGFYMHYQSLTSMTEPLDAMVIELDTRAPKNGPDGPGTYKAMYDNIGDCGLCLYLLQGWANGGYAKLLVPTQGSIEVQSLTEAGGPFKAVVHDIVFQEATFSQQTGDVTFVSNGMTWCLKEETLQAEILVTQEICVPGGKGSGIGDNIADFQLQNCEGNWVSLHDGCGDAKALWLIAAAGW